MDVLGIDIGGSGIKGAVVDTEKGVLKTERLRMDTPTPATPQAVVETVAELLHKFNWQGPIGCGFPAVIHGGVGLETTQLPLVQAGIVSNDVQAAVVTDELEISMVRGQPSIRDCDDTNSPRTHDQASRRFLTPVSGVAVNPDLHLSARYDDA